MKPDKRASSLRRQLLTPLLWIWLLGMSAAALGAYGLSRSSANAAFDRSLQDEAGALAAKIIWTDRGPLLDMSRQTLELLTWDSTERNSFALLDERGHVLAGESGLPRPDLRHNSFAHPVLFDGAMDGEPVRGAMFSLTSPMLDRSVSIVVVETRHKRDRLVRDVLMAMALPTLALGLLTFALLAWGVRRGLQPLREVAREVARRAPSDLRPLPTDGVPAEAQPLIERINSLLLEVTDSIDRQRRFVADAAHQLRTPVAGLRVLAQELMLELRQQGGDSEAQLQPLVAALLKSSDRLARLIGQLLSLVRSQGSMALESEAFHQDLRPLLREAAEPLALQAARKGRSLVLDMPDVPVIAFAHSVWLGEALSNALDNALRYGGPQICLRLIDEPGGARIEIEDDGPGVAAADLGRLAEPFWRGERADTRSDGGSGLGLAIAYEIVTRLGGRWTAQTRPELAGFRLVWQLPA